MAVIPQQTGNTSSPPMTRSELLTLLCPQCGGRMAFRTNKAKGTEFLGCLAYPACTGTRNGMNGLPTTISNQTLSRLHRILKAAVLASEEECLTFSEAQLTEADSHELHIEQIVEERAYVVTTRKTK